MDFKISAGALDALDSVYVIESALKKASTGRAIWFSMKYSKSLDRFVLPICVLSFISFAYALFNCTVLNADGWVWPALVVFFALAGLGGAWFFRFRISDRLPNSDRFKKYNSFLGAYYLALRSLIYSQELNLHSFTLEEYGNICRLVVMRSEVSKSKGVDIGFFGTVITAVLTSVLAMEISNLSDLDIKLTIIMILGCLLYLYFMMKILGVAFSCTLEEKKFLMNMYGQEMIRRISERGSK